MFRRELEIVRRLIVLLVGFLILKVTAEIVWGYNLYFPPNFNSDFLRGREDYFFRGYAVPFYAHILVGPVTLLLGGFLISQQARRRLRLLHRAIGRVQIALVLLVLAPSGLILAFHSTVGWIATISFSSLSMAISLCVIAGWLSAVRRRFSDHQRWMERCFVLLCSAVALRLMAGLAVISHVHADWFDAFASVACWTIPLLLYEVVQLRRNRKVRIEKTLLSLSSTGFEDSARKSR